MTDNGYLPWSVTVPPMKTTVDMAELRWSKWAESNRKDSECYFAIVKGRFRYLKAGIRGNRVEDADKVFMTCVAFHNWLLENDGLDKEWKSGKQGTWEGAEGTYQLPSNASRIVSRLASPTDAQNRDGQSQLHCLLSSFVYLPVPTYTFLLKRNRIDQPPMYQMVNCHFYREIV
jgi:hypothetical protein